MVSEAIQLPSHEGAMVNLKLPGAGKFCNVSFAFAGSRHGCLPIMETRRHWKRIARSGMYRVLPSALPPNRDDVSPDACRVQGFLGSLSRAPALRNIVSAFVA